MESSTFEELSDHFTSKLDRIGILLNLRDASKDDTCVEQLQLLQTELGNQEKNLALVKKELATRQKALDRIKSLNKDLIEWKKKLTYMVENIPERLPARKKNIISDVPVVTGKMPLQEVPAPSQNITTSVTNTKSKEGMNGQRAGKLENTYYPEIEFLTTDEFEQIPKYLKGRMTYDQVNKFIEGMNKSYRAKYKLLKQKKATLNDANRKRYEAYKMQETKETKGCYFVVDEDLKDTGGLKVDNVARSTLTILRHCGRCREIRGGRLTRYCYIDNY
ncbi:spindle and kinetochore-associated protein 1-like [Mercenaria mercenaria]|uniref:spindle and kinetochore-associated protein 1-like n=1 Tax=Mercenaria mercenaria TaxID=6596 RepID=UPI00234ED445|nr:spindle and kinetochore-associated protein 1-like [Mercenaria mercenaria]